MCGLYGYSLNQNKVSIDRVSRLTVALAITNQERGSMSWGASAGHGRRVAGIGGASRGIGKIIPHAISSMEGGLIKLLGHTRLATQGKVNTENCHPFVGKNFTLAHNGQVYNVKHRVDSLALLEKLEGGESFESLTGYGIAIWWEKGSQWATIARLSAGGDIAIASGPWGSAWSSDKEHLEVALNAAGLSHKKNHRWLVDLGEAVEVSGDLVYKAPKYAGTKRWALTPAVYGSDSDWRKGYLGGRNAVTLNGKPYNWPEMWEDEKKSDVKSDDKQTTLTIVPPTTEIKSDTGATYTVPADPTPPTVIGATGNAPGRKRVTPYMLKSVADGYGLTEADMVAFEDDEIRDAFFELGRSR